ncbi:hypothetical protein RHSIM_Rhsim03G0269800 [Rhododendron simsii]|uniref:Uncharacterized protein n=1 Tax=Rhododendron simsii TaxID=118357 RepID=A0A834H5N9_RHOSS|nr:hypothetical protein RHSIM_Rhsim03G0269800 [Rhododendron simsii]
MRKKKTNAHKMRRTYSVSKSELKMLTILKGKFWSIIRAIGSKFAEKKETIDILTKAIKRIVPVSYWEDLLSLDQLMSSVLFIFKSAGVAFHSPKEDCDCGLRFRKTQDWNNAAMLLDLWAVCKKIDTLWVK